MGMKNPHSPETNLWDAYTEWADAWKKDPSHLKAKETSDYYYDQWEKQVEKRVVAEFRSHKIKETAGDKMPKVKPKADRLSSK